MKTQLLILVFIAIGRCANAQIAQDVLHYRYQIELNDRNDTIYGRAEIDLVANSRSIRLQLSKSNPAGKGMILDSVYALKDKSRVNFFPSTADKNSLLFNEDTISVMNAGVGTPDTFRLVVLYHGIPSDGLIISKNKYGDRTFFADNWPDRAHNWIPCVDNPDDKASFEFIVTAPSTYSVIANGIKTEEKEVGEGKKLTHWKEDTPLPTKIMVIGVSRFAVKTFADSPPGIPVSAWVYPQDSTAGFKNYSPAPAILKFLSAYIGPYPYKKLANVQSKTIFGGMENASAIFYYEESATSRSSIETLLAHEITHQWFGDMATEKSFPHLWLSEGFATYFTHVYMESKYGAATLKERLEEDRGKIITYMRQSGNPVVDSLTPTKELLNANSYEKGGWVLHMLRRQLGDSIFHRVIRRYYASYAGRNADTRDFEKICEQVSGKDLKQFFDQWLYTPGIPVVDVKWKYDPKKKMVMVTVTQLQKILFQFPLDISFPSVKTCNSRLETLSVSKQEQQFSFSLKEKPVKLILDPTVALLFEGSASMIK